ncbi:MAG TPA: hypothetical protein VFR71_00630 [Methyloceanibacter sp.]|nr:hypothetical protein [Methyloceanibacter sp.]
MAGASKTLDPIAAAEAGIAGSKDLIATVARDLGQHERWLAHYHVAEKRHARRVLLHELVYRIEFARQHLMRMVARFSLRVARAARATALILWGAAVSVFNTFSRAALAAYAWLRPRAYAAVLMLRIWLTTFMAWALATSRSLVRETWEWLHVTAVRVKARSRAAARISRECSAAAADWAARHARIAAKASLEWGAAAAVWSGRYARVAANATEKHLANTWAATSRMSGIIGRASAQRAAAATAWTIEQSRRLAQAAKQNATNAAVIARDGTKVAGAKAKALTRGLARTNAGLVWSLARAKQLRPSARSTGAEPGINHRALTIRRCTALICVEPRRDRLPALRAG